VDAAPGSMEALPILAFQAALLFCRLAACAMLLPGLGEQVTPATIRLGLALAVTALLFPGLAPTLPAPPDSAIIFAGLVATEVMIGLWIGWLARLTTLALSMTGHLIGYLIGLSNVLIPDPMLGGEGSPLSRFLGLGGAALVLSTGLYALPLRALAESYAVLPIGLPLPDEFAAASVANAVGACFLLALRLAAPFVLLSIVVQLLGGLIGRVAPQSQAFILALPLQLILGLLLLVALLPAIFAHYGDAAMQAWRALAGLG
jgi:flagellar biosynthetic protein FliR